MMIKFPLNKQYLSQLNLTRIDNKTLSHKIVMIYVTLSIIIIFKVNQYKINPSNLAKNTQQSYINQGVSNGNKYRQQPTPNVANKHINENQRKDSSANRKNNVMDLEKNLMKEELIDRLIQDKSLQNQHKGHSYQEYKQKQPDNYDNQFQQQQQQQRIKQINDRDVKNEKPIQQSDQIEEYEKQIKKQQDQIKYLQREVYKLKKENEQMKKQMKEKQKIDETEMKSIWMAMKMQEREQREIQARQYYEFMKEAMTPQNDMQDPDQMTYEQLLELQEKIGYVNRGYSKEEITTIEEVQINLQNKSDLPDQCSICFNNYQIGEKYRKLRCSHQYHSQCIEQWLSTEKKCPICKEEALE